MPYTGQLGTSDSQLGSIVLGSPPEEGGGGGASFTADAVISATPAGSLTADAVLRTVVSGLVTGDAALSSSTSSSISADACLLATIAGSLTADAILSTTASSAFTADAAVGEFGFTANAVIAVTASVNAFTADAILITDVFEDYFDRADGALGSDWTDIDPDLEIVSQAVEVPAGQWGDASPVHSPLVSLPSFTMFDFWVPSDPADGYHGYEIDANGRYAYIDNDSSDPSTLWTAYVQGSTSGDMEFPVEPNTWYRYRGYDPEFQNEPWGLKIWKRDEPEPELWTYVNVAEFAPGTYLSHYMYLDATGGSAEPSRVDGVRIFTTSGYQLPGIATFTANAVIQRTQESAAGGPVAARSAYATSGSISSVMSWYIPEGSGAKIGDLAFAFITWDMLEGAYTWDGTSGSIDGWTILANHQSTDDQGLVILWRVMDRNSFRTSGAPNYLILTGGANYYSTLWVTYSDAGMSGLALTAAGPPPPYSTSLSLDTSLLPAGHRWLNVWASGLFFGSLTDTSTPADDFTIPTFHNTWSGLTYFERATTSAPSALTATASDADLLLGAAISLHDRLRGFTADAEILIIPIFEDFPADATILKVAVDSLSANAIFGSSSEFSFSTQAIIAPRAFLADAVFFSSAGAASLTADAEIHLVGAAFGSFSADAVIGRVVFSDDFNRADGDPGSPWTADNTIGIEGNTLVVPGSGAAGVLAWGQLNLDPSSDVTQGTVTTIDVLVPVLGSSGDYWWVEFDGSTPGDQTTPARMGWVYHWTDGLYYLGAWGTSDTEIVLEEGEWYTFKLYFSESPDETPLLKFWKRSDPEPHEYQIIGEFDTILFNQESYLYLESRPAGNTVLDVVVDNYTITVYGPVVRFGSFSASAVLKKTIERSTPEAIQYVGFSTQQATTSTNPYTKFFTPGGVIQPGDLILVFGSFGNGNATITSSTTSVFLGRYVHIAGSTLPNLAVVAHGVANPLASLGLSVSGGLQPKILTLVALRNAAYGVRAAEYVATVSSSNLHVIPAGTLDLQSTGSIVISAFNSTLFTLTQSQGTTILSTGIGTSVNTLLAYHSFGVDGPSPAISASAVGVSTARRAAILEIVPRGGLFADAVIGDGATVGSFTANAFIVIPAPTTLIFEDTFTRVVPAGMGGNWELSRTSTGAFSSVDGFTATFTPYSESPFASIFVGYPMPSTGVLTMDVLWPNTLNGGAFDIDIITRESFNSQLIVGGLGNKQIGSASDRVPIFPEDNQWYSLRFEWNNNYNRTWFWKRSDPEPSEWLVTGSALLVSPQLAELTVVNDIRIDNVRIYTDDGIWWSHHGFNANAIKLRQFGLKDTFDGTHDTGQWVGMLFFVCDAAFAYGFKADAYILKTGGRVSASFSADALIVTYDVFRADAVIAEPIRTQHERDGGDHTGVDLETVHTLAFAIDDMPQGTNLRDVLIEIDARISALEAG
jgi:hypothetical protein